MANFSYQPAELEPQKTAGSSFSRSLINKQGRKDNDESLAITARSFKHKQSTAKFCTKSLCLRGLALVVYGSGAKHGSLWLSS